MNECTRAATRLSMERSNGRTDGWPNGASLFERSSVVGLANLDPAAGRTLGLYVHMSIWQMKGLNTNLPAYTLPWLWQTRRIRAPNTLNGIPHRFRFTWLPSSALGVSPPRAARKGWGFLTRLGVVCNRTLCKMKGWYNLHMRPLVRWMFRQIDWLN